MKAEIIADYEKKPHNEAIEFLKVADIEHVKVISNYLSRRLAKGIIVLEDKTEELRNALGDKWAFDPELKRLDNLWTQLAEQFYLTVDRHNELTKPATINSYSIGSKMLEQGQLF